MVLDLSITFLLTVLGMVGGFGLLKFLNIPLVRMINGIFLAVFLVGSSLAIIGYPELVTVIQTGTVLPLFLAYALGHAAGSIISGIFN